MVSLFQRMSPNYPGVSAHNRTMKVSAHSGISAVRFAYTKDTYNNPQNLWTFAYVITLHQVLLTIHLTSRRVLFLTQCEQAVQIEWLTCVYPRANLDLNTRNRVRVSGHRIKRGLRNQH